ncbi:MAG: metallophosphoesterase, partial [Acidobacteria bacterium]|nr:metallophosphoesterase [Acidobacteriota bacterium]
YNSLALSPLVSGTTYYWRVVAKTMANMESASPSWAFTTSGTAPAPPPPQPKLITLVRQPYLQQVTSTSAVVVWATKEPGDAKVLVTGPAGSAITVTAPWKLYAATATGMAADYYQFEARITGLTAATTYTYDIIVANEDLNAVTDTIKTAPATSASTVTFVTFGDSGTGSTGQQQVASRLQQENFDIALHGGDIAYANSSGTGPASHQTMQDWFFTPYSSWLRNKPVFPSMGNHDSRSTNADGRPYLDLYVLPTHGATPQYPDHAERYYSFDYGPMHVIVLDTEFAFLDPVRRAAQMAWAEADLAATTKPWKVALYHRSAYSAGGENGSELPVREVFAPLFDKYGVHLALSAHEHDYERTKPWRAGVADPTGTTYVVSGGGGGPLYPAGVAEWTAKSASVHHYVRGTATECTINLSAIGVDGVAFDSVELRRCETPTEPPTEPPPTPPVGAPNAQLGEGDILLYAADATTLVGRWQKDSDTTAAAGFKLRNPDAGGAKRTVALAAPADYFEMTFTAVPNTPYRFYMRGRGDGDTYSNDSVFVQFLGADGYAIGSTQAAEYNLEDCSGCRISGWGWQDNAWGVGVTSTPITFTTPGPHKLRVQVREDGLSIDQILFSPVKFFSTWPGTLLDDTRIYPRSSSSSTPPPPGNAAPTVTLTGPASGATFTEPATINLTATAADSDGTVASVAFYAGATLIGTDTSAPFAATWSGAAGSYSLTARATDNVGAVTTSAAVAITVQAATPTPNVAPTVSVTAPSAGATFTAPATINLTASAADSDGTVASVAFYAGATLIGTDTSAPFAATWSGAAAGSYSLTARATDNVGAVTTSAAVAITVQAGTTPPAPAWTSQDIGAVGLAGTFSENSGVFTIEGAGADIWGTADAFRYAWKPLSGDADIIARVSSIENVHRWVKAGVMIREHLTADSPQALMLVSPGKGLAFQRRITTAGLSTSTSGGSGTAPAWVKLERRANTITAYRSADGVAWTLVGSDMFTMGGTVYVGLAVSSHVTTSLATAVFDNVSIRAVGAGEPEPPPPSNAAPSVTLASPVTGTTFIAPASTTLSASASDSDGTVVRVDFYANAALIGSDNTAPFQVSWSGVPAGTYTLTARATDDDGAATTSAPVTVTVEAGTPTPPPTLSAPWSSQDIGAVGAVGSASDSSGVFTVKGAGSDIWATADAFRYVWQPLTGDADIVARVSSVENVHAWVKAGVMIREQLTPESAHALMLVSPGKGLAFQRRTAAANVSVSTSGGSGTAPNWVKLERRGNTITAYRSADGVTWTLVGSDTFTMGANVHVGLAVSSHVSGQLATAVFEQVTVTPR